MVDLVEDDKRPDREPPHGGRIECHLLIGDYHAVHIGRQGAVGC